MRQADLPFHDGKRKAKKHGRRSADFPVLPFRSGLGEEEEPLIERDMAGIHRDDKVGRSADLSGQQVGVIEEPGKDLRTLCSIFRNAEGGDFRQTPAGIPQATQLRLVQGVCRKADLDKTN